MDEPLGKLRARCSTAADTALSRLDVGPPFPGLVFRFDSLTVIALQQGSTVLDLSRAADGWIVEGSRATIQRKVSLSASWTTLYAKLGVAQANARGVLTVRFCSFPNAIMTLTSDPRAVLVSEGKVDLSSIPPDAKIHHLFIMSRELAGHFLGC